jgi:hypothetical protein
MPAVEGHRHYPGLAELKNVERQQKRKKKKKEKNMTRTIRTTFLKGKRIIHGDEVGILIAQKSQLFR